MGYQIVIDSAARFAIIGTFTGRCPLTGHFMGGVEFDDDEPVEHLFGGSYDPTDDIIAALDGEQPSDENDEFWGNDPTERFNARWALKFQDRCPMMWDREIPGDWWYEDETEAQWAERKYRHLFPQLWEEGYDDDLGCSEGDPRWFEMNHDNGDEVLMPAHSGGRQFRTWASWMDWEHRDDHGRHSYDQGKRGASPV